MKTIIHPSDSRGQAHYGWLDARYSFSFASWINHERIHFGALRVLNDDIVQADRGFELHAHDNMEIITIPLKGSVRHQDDLGNISIIKQGEIQLMSAGKGIVHGEWNHDKEDELNLLQIWILPNKRGVEPSYDLFKINKDALINRFELLVGPKHSNAQLKMHQDGFVQLANFNTLKEYTYSIKSKEHGVYFFIIEGSFKIADRILKKRDAIGIWEADQLDIVCLQEGTVLAIEVPMDLF